MYTMLPTNRWTKHYINLINKTSRRKLLVGYYENHHIIPKSLGGSNSKSNFVKLTAREHLVAHKLLCRVFAANKRDYRKMLGALWAMTAMRNKYSNNRKTISSREFEKLRQQYFSSRRGITPRPETKYKISQSLTGRKILPEIIRKRTDTLQRNIKMGITRITRRKLSLEEKALRKSKMKKQSALELSIRQQKAASTRSNWNQQQRNEYGKKLSKANCGKKRSADQCSRISRGLLGHDVSLKVRAKISAALKGQKRGARKPFTIISPNKETVVWSKSIHDFCTSYNVPIKYLYISRKTGIPIKKGIGKGWLLMK